MPIVQGDRGTGTGDNIDRVVDGPLVSLSAADVEGRQLLEGIALSLRQMVAGLSLLTKTDLNKIK